MRPGHVKRETMSRKAGQRVTKGRQRVNCEERSSRFVEGIAQTAEEKKEKEAVEFRVHLEERSETSR